jgi:hypothetical protein
MWLTLIFRVKLKNVLLGRPPYEAAHVLPAIRPGLGVGGGTGA